MCTGFKSSGTAPFSLCTGELLLHLDTFLGFELCIKAVDHQRGKSCFGFLLVGQTLLWIMHELRFQAETACLLFCTFSTSSWRRYSPEPNHLLTSPLSLALCDKTGRAACDLGGDGQSWDLLRVDTGVLWKLVGAVLAGWL